MGIYSHKIKDLKDLPDGAKVAIPNDPTNGGRALLILQSAGLIGLKDGGNITSTVQDVEKNDKHLQFAELSRPDCLLPVPMARKRLRERGFNQALMVARWLSAALDIPHNEHLLLRPHETVAQQDLDARTRKRNLLNAFALAPGTQVAGQHLALVDDVLTTGATAHALARLLVAAGARQVDVYCLARTPKPGT